MNSSLDTQTILGVDEAFAMTAIQFAIGEKVHEVGHLCSRGSLEEAGKSDWSPEDTLNLERRIETASAELRYKYIFLLGWTGGADAVALIQRVLEKTLSKDPEALTKEDLTLVDYCIGSLEYIGGAEAFHTLIDLREHKHPRVGESAQRRAGALARQHEPHDHSDIDYWDMTMWSQVESERHAIYERDYPLQKKSA